MHSQTFWWVPIALSLVLMAGAPCILAGQAYVGSTIDATGDSSDGPDITLTAIVIDDAGFHFKMEFAPGTFNPLTTMTSFSIDADQNPLTGLAWRGIGVEAMFEQGYLGDTLNAYLWMPGVGIVATSPVTFGTNSVQYEFPRDLLPDDGLINYIAAVQTALSSNSSTVILDSAPNPNGFGSTSADTVLLNAPQGNSYYGMYAASPSTAASFTLTASYNVSTINIVLRTPTTTDFRTFDFSLQNALSGTITTFAHESLTASLGGTYVAVLNVNKTLPAGTYYLVGGVPGYVGTPGTPGDVDGWYMSDGRYTNDAGAITDGVWFHSDTGWSLTSFYNNRSYYAPAFTVNGSPVGGTVAWQKATVSSPPPARGVHAMAFDEARGQIVMFGGMNSSSNHLGDTWIWDGNSWQQKNTAIAPKARAGHAMAYDAARGQVVLFGGSDMTTGTLYNDTWVWNGNQWTQKAVSTSPSGRTYNAMAYDAVRQQVVLFGGFDGAYNNYSDTWVWNGSNWQSKTPSNSPVGRAGHAMVFDAAHSQVVLFGGSGNDIYDDTWTWDGTNWAQKTVTTAPSARYWAAMAYDSLRKQTVLFGGSDDSSNFNDTWVWDGTTWAKQSLPLSPSPRWASQMAYDSARNQVVLFGGGTESQAYNDTWIWNGGTSPDASSIAGDIDGDGISDISVWRPNSGIWYSLLSSASAAPATMQWGSASDKPVPGDYDGDSKADVAVWRPSNGVWYARPSSATGTYTAMAWGISSDIAVPGDYDGDGKDDLAVWRPGNGTWYVKPSGSPSTYTSTKWGINGDIPVPGDFDGDGKTDLAVRRPNTGVWYIRKSSVQGSYTSTAWGTASDIPVPGDYDADGKTDIAVWRLGNGTWYIRPSNAGGYTTTSWGTNGDTPVSGDYDGDGKADIAVWRPGNGTWYIRLSGTPGSYTTRKWGVAGDMPISAVTGILNSIP